MSQLFVLIEHHDGVARKASLQTLGLGLKMAAEQSDRFDGGCTALVAGKGSGAVAATLGACGVTKTLVIEDDAMEPYLAGHWAAVIGDALAGATPLTLLAGATSIGKDLGPRLAQRLGAAYLADVTGLVAGDGGAPRWIRPIYAGKASEQVDLLGASAVVTVRPNTFPLPAASEGAAAPAATNASGARPANLTSIVREVIARSGLDQVELTEAEIIVSGGMGLGGPEGFATLRELCGVLGAALGASRAAVHADWIGAEHQVGQTGKTVSPQLYIACGISGAIQHQAGMRTSKCIVAINTDPEAPIFKIAHYGIVGDVKQVVPALTAEFRKLLAG
jgi:electron transfer flavoprotein alpha subunit